MSVKISEECIASTLSTVASLPEVHMTEATGDYALLGVDVISIGALTHSAVAADLSLDLLKSRK